MNAERFASLVLERLAAVEAELVAHRWPALSPWWKDLLSRFTRALVRQLVARVGRRGGKSSSAVVFAVAFALVYAGLGLVPPGDTGYVVFVAARRDEALARLRGIELVLRTLCVSFSPADGDAITIDGTNIGFRVLSCNVASVSGWTTILAVADEVAKWLNADTGQNPAGEVLASLRATMATQPLARMMLLSSPLSTEDAHAEAFDIGDTDAQIVAQAETWVANPTVTETETRKLEPDPRVWAREYAAVPQAAKLAAFDAVAVDRAFESRFTADSVTKARVMVIDASSGKKDTWAFAIAERVVTGLAENICFPFVDGREGRFFDQEAGEKVIAHVATVAKKEGITTVYGDQRESLMIASAFKRHGLRFVECPWTATSKPDAVARVRRWLADGTLVLAKHDKMRKEMLAFEERVTPNGVLTYGARGGKNDDYVALLITAAMADMAGAFRESNRGAKAPAPEIGIPILERGFGFGDEGVPGMDAQTAEWFRATVR